MGNIVFVVLHYETIDDTRKCIDSLLKYLTRENVYIVVVDNGSKVGKLKEIEPVYAGNDKVCLLYSKENLGFAKGNNLGYEYAKKNLNAEIIILANNDLVFEQENFIEELTDVYRKTSFDVAGGKIVSLVDGKNQNPVPIQYNSKKDVVKRLIKFKILNLLSVFELDTLIQKKVAKEIEEFIPKQNEDFQLHGACMFFANKYVEKFDGLFEKTFMYGEESILKYITQKEHMKMKYFDTLHVFHKEGSATGAIFGKGKKKRQFYYKWNINSCKLLYELMKEK